MKLKIRKKTILWAAVALVVIAGAAVAWNILAGTTRIAFVNYQAITLGQISKANDTRFVKLETLPIEQIDKARNYDMVFVNGMGLRLTEDERRALTKAAESGVPVLTTAATNPQNLIVSVDSADAVRLTQYLAGGKGNLRNLLRYVRKNIDGKKMFAPAPGDPVLAASSLLYYPGDEEAGFNTVAEFEAYLQQQGKYRPEARRIILTGQMGVPDSLVSALERKGHMVYPVRAIQQLITTGGADSISPSAVINMAHGRMGDMVVKYLEKNNLPLFSPLNVNRDYEEWMADKMGMNGGFLSQSVVTPEIDGAVRPYVLFAHFKGEDGLPYVDVIPDRLDSFVETVDNYLALQTKPNREKKVAIFYFKGPGQNALVAEGMEVAPSLFNLLTRLKQEGYTVENLPVSAAELEKMINEEGKVFNAYATGAKAEFVAKNQAETVSMAEYEKWSAAALSETMRQAIVDIDGPFPGGGLQTPEGDLALARLKFGNVVLIPQTAAGLGDDDFKIVHGTDAPPPHAYVASYLWAKHGFGADALMHFGAHGSLEFTPRKQVALSSEDWSDRLVGTLPHVYVYSTGNVGEAMTAKRRSYAGIVSYLTPPFKESEVRGIYKNLSDAVEAYNKLAGAETVDGKALEQASLQVKKYAVALGVHRELRLDSAMTVPYTAEEVARIENFAEELANEKITGALYVMGRPYEEADINSTVYAMTVDPVAYSLYNLDRMLGRTTIDYNRQRARFNRIYGSRARNLVRASLSGGKAPEAAEICREASITPAMQEKIAAAVSEVERALKNVTTYKSALSASPESELTSVVNALAGGYISPTSGGDPVLNPEVLPTGRNMYAVNAEQTPSAAAWEKGKALVENTLAMYRKAHGDSLPRKVSYTLWSSEFIETEGATIAQVLYMLGVEPVRDPFGRVTDLRLIPAEELGRPRIDVVVQTSGQLRDLAASRLFLISRAVKMAAEADDGQRPNYVAEGVLESEKYLVNKGVAPIEARQLSKERVFGGVNGNYGSGIQGMVEAGDRWEESSEIASTYINNMGALYGSEEGWEGNSEYAFEAALTRTDVVVQPRQSNTWGALSLDHVYEFMGGMNLAVQNVTGKDPEAYLSDYRNRNNARMQEVKEAIGVESRTTILNPAYIKNKMKGGAGDASGLADVVRNTYGWNVMKPDVIDNELWNDIYDTYVADKHGLGTKEYFTSVNPAAIEEITAVMLETARKGMWQASDEQIRSLAELHTEVVNEYMPSCSGFVCDNAKLRDFITQNVSKEAAASYSVNIGSIRGENIGAETDGTVLRKEELAGADSVTSRINGIIVGAVVAVALILMVLFIRKRKNQN